MTPAPADADRPPLSAAERLLVPFAERTRAEQVLGGLVIPAAFGALCGVVLGWSAAVYWILQAIAAVGGVAGGFEHRGARAGALRGVWGGLVFGVALLLGHAVAGTDAVIDNAAPAGLPLITAALGALLGALGGARRRAFDGRRTAPVGAGAD